MSEAVPTLETPRLLLQPLEPADAPVIQAVFPQWEIVRQLNARVPWPYPDDGALCFVRDAALPAMERGEAWHWTLRPKIQPSRLIGMISLMRGEANRGFWMDPAWQRRGLMTEAAIAVTGYWFDVLGERVLRVPKATDNVASRRISEKMGMRVVERIEQDYVGGRMPAEIWEITAEEWRAWKQSQGAS